MPLHPQAQAFLDGLAEQDGPGWEELPPAEGREIFASLTDLFGEGPEVAGVEDRLVRDDLAIRAYTPKGDGPFPGIVFFHGGGWVMGDLDTHDALCRRLTNEAEAVVVSVGYRRPPETVFPGVVDDCYQATAFVAEHASSLRIDPSRIVVAGDSAGGHLASAVAFKASDEGGPKLCLQVLIYPVLDARCESASYGEFAEGHGLTKASMEWFWQQFLGSDTDARDPLVSLVLEDNLQRLPPTHIVTAEYDVLRDEGEQYVQQLKDAGVPTTHQRYDGMLHGFIHFCGLFDAGLEATSDIAKVIREATQDNASH